MIWKAVKWAALCFVGVGVVMSAATSGNPVSALAGSAVAMYVAWCVWSKTREWLRLPRFGGRVLPRGRHSSGSVF